MKLDKAIELGKACGLSTIGECIANVDYHAMNIFKYEEINTEINELLADFRNSGLSQDSGIKEYEVNKL